MSDAREEGRILAQGLKAFVIKNYLPLAFGVAVIIALAAPAPGVAVLKPEVLGVHIVTFINICIVFFISGLTLRTDELKKCFTKRTAPGSVFGFLSIVAITPVLGFAIRMLPFSPVEFTTGLTIFCVVPTTLGVGVSLVTSAKGNVALAIFLTVATNIVGVVLIPLWLRAMLSTSGGGVESINIDFVDIFVKLLISNLVPTLLGKAVREFVPGALDCVREYKLPLSIISNTNLALIIWQTLSSARSQIVNTSFGTMLLVMMTAMLIHILYLVFNTAASRLIRIPFLEAIATVIMASQKSAPVAVTVITYITSNPAKQGLFAVPCIVGQLLQIFLGQPLANYLSGRVVRWEVKQAKEKLQNIEVAVAGKQDAAVLGSPANGQ